MMAEASKDSGYVDNWQAGKTITECNLHMLTTEDCSDVIFRVGSEKHVVRAHRYVLVSRSCVFHAMFCGPLAEKGEVTIPDIDPKIFSEFLRYIYTDSSNITSKNITGLLYTSRKYAVDALFSQCTTFLEKSLSEYNVCQILEQCHGYGELDLEKKAFKILAEAGEKVITSPGFLDLCSGCFGHFLKSDRLNLTEDVVFQATLSWGKEHCKKENIDYTPENLRQVLGDLRYEIRFCTFPLDYLIKVVRPSGILTEVERVRIMDKTVDKSIDISPFKSGSRNKCVRQKDDRLPSKLVNRFINICGGYSKWPCTGEKDAISFSVNKTIQLEGCQLYGPRFKDESTYILNILLYDDQDQAIAEPVPTSEWQLEGGEGNKVNNVMFPDAIPLVAGRTYTICVTMMGKPTYYGHVGQTSVTDNGVTFTFRDSPRSLSEGRTTVNAGQIPRLAWI